MEITLTPEQTAWLRARMAEGESTSVEQAVQRLFEEAMSREPDADEDLAWAKPLVDEAVASVARGEVISLDDHRAHTTALLARLAG